MLKGLTALITGATSGIGLGIAESLAKKGVDMLIGGLATPEEAQVITTRISNSHSVRCFYNGADLNSPEQIRDMVYSAEIKLGKIDILINNAGIQFVANVEDFPTEKWDSVLAVNLNAAFHTMKAALPGMKQRNFGRIINIASAHGLVASAGKSAYVTSKHGLLGLTKVVALETADLDITCNAICPGWVDTPLVRNQIISRSIKSTRSPEEEELSLLTEKQPKKKFTTPENVGELAAFLCGSHASTITGSSLSMDGGWTAI